jgi:hypothetical protein
MDLDRHSIVVRPRSYLEILDLSLAILRGHGGALLAAVLPGVLAAMALNAWLLGLLFEPATEFAAGLGYVWWMLLLVLWEAPLVTAPATLYLGQVLFHQQPRVRGIVGNLLGSLWQMTFYELFLRGLLLVLPITWFWPFAARPFVGEVILLERNPFATRRRSRMTTRRRINMLHSGAGGDLFFHWLGTVACGVLLFLSAWGSLSCLGKIIFGAGAANPLVALIANLFDGIHMIGTRDINAMLMLYYPTALWMVVAFFSVVRFLDYLDLRIRREGWEVELLMRAEGSRLTRQWT